MLEDRSHHPVCIEANEKTPSLRQNSRRFVAVFSHISGQHTGHDIGKVGESLVHVS